MEWCFVGLIFSIFCSVVFELLVVLYSGVPSLPDVFQNDSLSLEFIHYNLSLDNTMRSLEEISSEVFSRLPILNLFLWISVLTLVCLNRVDYCTCVKMKQGCLIVSLTPMLVFIATILMSFSNALLLFEFVLPIVTLRFVLYCFVMVMLTFSSSYNGGNRILKYMSMCQILFGVWVSGMVVGAMMNAKMSEVSVILIPLFFASYYFFFLLYLNVYLIRIHCGSQDHCTILLNDGTNFCCAITDIFFYAFLLFFSISLLITVPISKKVLGTHIPQKYFWSCVGSLIVYIVFTILFFVGTCLCVCLHTGPPSGLPHCSFLRL